MPEFSAVMVIGHFIVSVFQVPLGQPLYQFVPFPSMEKCEEYVQYMVTPPTGHTMSLEYKMWKSAQCVTKEEFKKQMELHRPKKPEQIVPGNDGWK